MQFRAKKMGVNITMIHSHSYSHYKDGKSQQELTAVTVESAVILAAAFKAHMQSPSRALTLRSSELILFGTYPTLSRSMPHTPPAARPAPQPPQVPPPFHFSPNHHNHRRNGISRAPPDRKLNALHGSLFNCPRVTRACLGNSILKNPTYPSSHKLVCSHI